MIDTSFLKTLLDFDFMDEAVLCSQLEWKGSVPRKDYPQMFVLKNGMTFGTIGGGQMEFEVIEKAREVINTGVAVFEKFDLTNADPESEAGICGGNTRVLIEPFTRDTQSFYKQLESELFIGNEPIIITIVSSGVLHIIERHLLLKNKIPHDIPEKLARAAKNVWVNNKSMSLVLENALCLVQLIRTACVLHIFGAGHVAKAVADLADFVGFEVVIYDDRHDLANTVRFPYAREIFSGSVECYSEKSVVNPNDFVLVATRGHQHDLEIMRWLLSINLNYLGLVSSKNKWKILSDTLINEGHSPLKIAEIYAPVGLDIDSETVPEIAISIISEIIYHAHYSKKSVLSLSNDAIELISEKYA